MSETLRVLQVEDVESDAALVIRLLVKFGYDVHSERVEDARQMRRALASETWDVVIADYRLPQFDAAEALRILHEFSREIPFIVVSGTIGEDIAVEMMRAGAQDYVLKDRIARLAPVVERETREAQSRRERRLAEERVRDREAWLALAVGVAHLGLFDFYPQSGKYLLSEGGKRHVGLPLDADVSYEMVMSAVHPDDRDCVKALIQKALDPETSGEYQADYRVAGITDRIERWLSAQGRVFFDLELRPIRFVGVTIDITQRKQLEDQFRQSQKLEGVGRLAGGVAHDFNNLLTVISGFSQMTLEELPEYHPVRGNVEEVIGAAARATNLTRQLLAFSRRHSSQMETIVLNELIASIQNMLGRLIGADVDLSVSLDPAAGAVRADAGHLEQVIMNLVINAKDAMPNGGKLSVETGHRVIDGSSLESHIDLAPGNYAALSVSDSGTGISPEVKARMFDPFFTTKELGKGTGLGLSTVYEIVKQCGGSISVQSELGRGTKFTILLPAFEAPDHKASALESTPAHFGTETILVVEDEAMIRRFIRESLAQHGYQVLECSNGREAIERARQYPDTIHLLLTDAVMPEMGGAELAEHFSACRPGVPVLCMSGYSDLIWPRTAVEGTCLQKPFTAKALLARVREVLDHVSQMAF